MKTNLFNRAASTIDEAVASLDKAIKEATDFESTDKFAQLPDEHRNNLVDAIYQSQYLSYRYLLLQVAGDEESRESNNEILFTEAKKQTDNLNRLMTA